MTEADQAFAALKVRTRVAAACGAVGVPGDGPFAALDAMAERFAGPLSLGSDDRLGFLALEVTVSPDVAEDVFDALGADPGPLLALVDRRSGVREVRLRVEARRDGETTVGGRVEVDVPVAIAVQWLALAGVAGVVFALELGRAVSVGVQGDRAELWLGHVGSAASGDRLAAAIGGDAGAGQRRVLLAAGLGRAVPVVLRAGPEGVEVGVRYPSIAEEGVLRLALDARPDLSMGAMGALAAAAEADAATVEVVSGADGSRVRFDWHG